MASLPSPVEPRTAVQGEPSSSLSTSRILPRLEAMQQGLTRVREGLEDLTPALTQARLSMSALKASGTASQAARRRTYLALRDLHVRSRELSKALTALDLEL